MNDKQGTEKLADGIVWSAAYHTVRVYVRDRWMRKEGFFPFAGGCGIHEGFKTKEEAIEYCKTFAEARLFSMSEAACQEMIACRNALSALKEAPHAKAQE